jgi:hypothetical protein
VNSDPTEVPLTSPFSKVKRKVSEGEAIMCSVNDVVNKCLEKKLFFF